MEAKYNDEAKTFVLDGIPFGPYKSTVYNTAIKPFVGAMVAQGKTVEDVKAFLSVMPDALDSEGKKVAEIAALCTKANALLVGEHRETAKGLLSTLDVLEGEYDEAHAGYEASYNVWAESESGVKLAKAIEAETQARLAREAVETGVKAEDSYKQILTLETALGRKANAVETAKVELTSLRRKIVGENTEFDVLTITSDDNGQPTFAASRRARKPRVSTGAPSGKGNPLVVNGVTYTSAAGALRTLCPEFVREHGANFSRANIVATLRKSGFNVTD